MSINRKARRACALLRPLRVPLLLALVLALSPVLVLVWLLALPVLGLLARRCKR